MAEDACTRRVAASTPETGAARRRSAGVSPGGGSRRPKRAWVVATRSGGARAHIHRFRAGVRASTAAGTKRGQRGPHRRAGASATVCARDNKWRGIDAQHTEKGWTCLRREKMCRL
jgi:hypothetical protein